MSGKTQGKWFWKNVVNPELMYIPLIVSIRSSLIYLHGFQVLLLLPVLIEIISFDCININLCLTPSLDGFVILMKQKSISLSWNQTLGSFGKLLIVLSRNTVLSGPKGLSSASGTLILMTHVSVDLLPLLKLT